MAGTGGLTLLDVLAQWWRHWRRKRACQAGLQACGPEETARIAQDSGVGSNELRTLAGKWPSSAEALSRRLVATRLDEAEIGREEPQALRDLQRVCSLCGSKGRCDHDLVQRPDDPVWRDYCPNVVTLDALAAERKGKPAKAD